MPGPCTIGFPLPIRATFSLCRVGPGIYQSQKRERTMLSKLHTQLYHLWATMCDARGLRVGSSLFVSAPERARLFACMGVGDYNKCRSRPLVERWYDIVRGPAR